MSKEKVGVLTYHDINNYGAQLQAASLQRFVESLGVECEIVHYCPWRSRIRQAMVFIRALSRFDVSLFRFEVEKRRSFASAIRRLSNLGGGVFYTQNGVGRECYSKYSTLICGSDELWNFGNYLGYQKPYIIDFSVADHVKKISYAASMGSCLPSADLTSDMYSALSRFDSILVRDPHTKAFVEAGGFRVERVADPTFLWDFGRENVPLNRPYLLLTGALCAERVIVDNAVKFAENNDLEIVSIGVAPPGLEHSVRQATPEEWINYIFHAKYHITSLFHGSIFSMKSQTNFCVIVSDDKSKKVNSLLSWVSQDARSVRRDVSYEDMCCALNSEFSKDFEKKIESITKVSKMKLANSLGLKYGS